MIDTENKLNARKAAKEISKLLYKRKCEKIVLMDVSKLTGICYYFIIATLTSTTHLTSIVNEIPDFMEENPELFNNKKKPFRNETKSPNWNVLDFGSIIVHLMTEQVREFYDLERIWFKARLLKFK